MRRDYGALTRSPVDERPESPRPLGARRRCQRWKVAPWGENVRMRRKGFTLIELLVVVAIIVILAGILYPVFAATRRAAYNAACLSNLKQIGLAVSMYTQDYDETFPTACCQTDRAIGKAQPANWPKSTT